MLYPLYCIKITLLLIIQNQLEYHGVDFLLDHFYQLKILLIQVVVHFTF